MVPRRLRKSRLSVGLSQEKLGVLAGIDESTAKSRISHYEIGTHNPSFELMCKIANVLDIPVGYFYTEDDDFAEDILKLYQNQKHR